MTGTSGSINRVDGAWVQTGAVSVSRSITGADRTYVHITEVPTLTVNRAGIWDVRYSARVLTAIPASTAGSQYLTVALFRNGVLLPGSESISGFAVSAGESVSRQEMVGQAFLASLTEGDQITMHAYRIGQVGTTSIHSTVDGRTWVSMHWIAPPGDTSS